MAPPFTMSPEAFEYAVHHVFLPPRLPQSDDFDSSHEDQLLRVVLKAMERFKAFRRSALDLQRAIDMVRTMISCRVGDSLLPAKVSDAIRNLSEGACIAFDLRSQNAGVLIYRGQDVVRFEQFELLARNTDVMSCKGRLRRRFPGSCVELDYAQFDEPKFQSALVDLFVRLDENTHTTCLPKPNTGGDELNYEHDTVEPRLIGLLTGFLRGLGHQGCSTQIMKHTREEVLRLDDRVSWHRSPSWMFLRICLQLVLNRGFEAVQSCLYKEFMAFLMAELLQHGLSMDIPDHLLYSMVAKVNRRFLKLSPALSFTPGWFAVSSSVVEKIGSKLGAKWTTIQNESKQVIDLEALRNLRFRADASLSLNKFRPHLEWIGEPNRNMDNEDEIVSESWFSLTRVEPTQLPDLKAAHSLDQHVCCYVLADFENWVAENLQEWLVAYVSQKGTCKKLMVLIEDYHMTATKVYQKNPIKLSDMWVVIMELWIACDKSVTQIYPLLKNYPIGLPSSLLEPLLTPTKSHMERLQKIENYLGHRDSEAKNGFPSALGGLGDKYSFAARFYATSKQHKQLHQQILASAKKAREDKLAELASKKDQYAELQSRFESAVHEETTVKSRLGWETVCKHDCAKCALEKSMDIRIGIHEWPLLSDDRHAKAVAFELQVPRDIAAWRKVTMALMIDKLRSSEDKTPPHYANDLHWVSDYAGLSEYTIMPSSSRLELASTTNPLSRSIHISEACENNVCRSHACQYDYYDRAYRTLLSKLVDVPIVLPDCSFAQLSKFPIPDWIGKYTHSSNQVISKQVLCPGDWTLDEFKAFGHLRSGIRLQWRNVLTQLMIPSLDLNKVETAYLIIQATYQAGPTRDNPESIYRDAHEIVGDGCFSTALIKALWTTLARVEENWECDIVLLSLVIVCARLLSLSTSMDARQECLGFLARVRAISRRWIDVLLDQKAASELESERNSLDLRILSMALLCMHTFNVDLAHLESVLSVDGAEACFIEVSIIIHNHVPKRVTLPALTLISLQTWQGLSYKVSPMLIAKIVDSRDVIDEAIATFWADYTPGAPWLPMEQEYGHILRSQSATTLHSKGLPVSLNLLDGSLLVNGLPLSRLPSEIQNHSTYARLFGTQILDIVPSGLPFMDFSAARKQGGWVVHFAMIGEKLVIQAYKDDLAWEFIPPSEIIGDFPTSLINPCSHWLNITASEVEFRSYHEPWKSHGSIWRMSQRNDGWVLSKGGKMLIDPRSATAKTLMNIFKPIEDSRHINCIFDPNAQQLEVNLPRYDLTFTLGEEDGILRSKHYPGMCVDTRQAFDTLVGLVTKLVLRPEDFGSNTMRAILVPHGSISSTKRENIHPLTAIHPPTEISLKDPGYPVEIPRRRHHCFHVDTTLGRLIDNGSLQSKLLLCHLHATTSYCLPDVLTGLTGTEEALRILKSAAVVSFDRLEKEDILMLSAIASISPRRTFYPSHLKTMQAVQWSEALDPLAQSDEYAQVVGKILDHGASCEMFFPDDAKKVPKPKTTNTLLRDRALLRCSTFRVFGFGAENHTASCDVDYNGRDTIEGSMVQLEKRVCQIVQVLLAEKQVILENVSNLMAKLYGVMGSTVAGPNSQSVLETYQFDIQWLDKPSICIGWKWCQIQKNLCHVNLSNSKYELMTFFGALVFAEDADSKSSKLSSPLLLFLP